jgi:succinylarginine dihydrolase
MKVTIVYKFQGYDLQVYTYTGEPLKWNRLTSDWKAKYRSEDGQTEEVYAAVDTLKSRQILMRTVLENRTVAAAIDPEVISDDVIVIARRPCEIPHAELFLLELKTPWPVDPSIKYFVQSFRGRSSFRTLVDAEWEFKDPQCDLLK